MHITRHRRDFGGDRTREQAIIHDSRSRGSTGAQHWWRKGQEDRVLRAQLRSHAKGRWRFVLSPGVFTNSQAVEVFCMVQARSYACLAEGRPVSSPYSSLSSLDRDT